MRDRNDSVSLPTGSHWETSAGTSAVQLTWGYAEGYSELFAQLRGDGWLDDWGTGPCVLDCGTGTGVLIRALPADLTAGLHVHGVDRSPGMLARAALELGRLGCAVELHRADVRRLPFPSGRFDLVMSAHMLEHLPNPLEGLREMTRVLRPDGALLLVTTRPGVPEAYLRLIWRYRTFDPAWLLRALRERDLVPARCYSVGRRPRIARWLSLAYVGRKRSETSPMLAALWDRSVPRHAPGSLEVRRIVEARPVRNAFKPRWPRAPR